jgi:hypothetical protein
VQDFSLPSSLLTHIFQRRKLQNKITNLCAILFIFCVFSSDFTVCKTENFKNNSMICLFLTNFLFVFSSDLQFAQKENYKTRT